jgi:hypothetical protein
MKRDLEVICRRRSEVDEIRHHYNIWIAWRSGEPADVEAAQAFQKYLLDQIASPKDRERFTEQLLKSFKPHRLKLIDYIEAELALHPDFDRAQIEAEVRRKAGRNPTRNSWRDAWAEIRRSHY